MTIGIPIIMSFQDSSVKDPALTLGELMQDCQSPIFSKGLELRDSEFVYEYDLDLPFIPKIWNQTDQDNGVYDLDEVIFKDCGLVKVTGKRGDGFTEHRRALEPEEYGSWDSGVDFANYSNRYMRVSANATNCGWLTRTWKNPNLNRFYCMTWECRGIDGCSVGAWIWTVKDLTYWGCDAQAYQKSCLQNSYSTKFDAAKDLKAVTYDWQSKAGTGAKEPIILFKSVIERNGYFYFRTHLNKLVEYQVWITGQPVEYTFMNVVAPSDIDGFIQKRRLNQLAPFDGRNYTKCVENTEATGGKATWRLMNMEAFDSIAFGGLICDSLDVRFFDTEGNLLDEVRNYTVDNTIDPANPDIEYHTTSIIYTNEPIATQQVVEITLWGDNVTVGEIWGAKSLSAGYTTVSFENKLKDFSPSEESQWGDWDFVEGLKVMEHSGTVEFKILSYDKLNRLMLLLGGRKIVVNGSDSKENQAPDGENVFSSTMMIGRFLTFKLSTEDKNKRIGDVGKYTFVIRELV